MKSSIRHHLSAAAAIACVSLVLASSSRAQAADASSGEGSRRVRPAKGSAQEVVRSGTVVAPGGQVAITSIDRKWDDRTGTGTLNEAAVTPDGRMYTREANLTRHADGTIVAKGTFTDFDGRSFNYTETNKTTAAGPVVAGTMTDVDGKVSTYTTTSSQTADRQTARTTLITHPDGTTETRREVLARARVVAGL